MHSQYFSESGPKFLIKLTQKAPKISEGNTTKTNKPQNTMISDRKFIAQENSTESRACTLYITFPWPGKKYNQVDLGALKSYHEICGVQYNNNTWIPPSLHIPASQKLFPAKTGASLNKNHTSKADICHLSSALTTEHLENFTEQAVIMETLPKSRAGSKLFHKKS